ncbi:polysaccharide deacetylase family protein [Aliiglaciecola sp. CAU 1673]|uniref:polysaccharide deacetylase family protein n=1 Tax=Aliiglaciecola sp. CAU 1673 TaxID=3032595 RepID=UPI0023DB7E30|nr:polysaccharide deacetylase family protein [Aliiglaciecola sp. CAU 1673]MDF2179249.1 polysaccharide deacetylase family protein [Aliiglaciecola sp. CAU 1673]
MDKLLSVVFDFSMRKALMLRLKIQLLLCLFLVSTASATALDRHGVILMYHHVSSSTPASTSVSVAQFEEHMAYVAKHHQVIPLPDMVSKLQKDQPLGDKAIAITFDDGFDNIFENAHPILKRYGFNYTVFINPALIGKQPQQLTWDQVKAMAKEGVWFANHSDKHDHLLTRHPGQSDKAWLEAVIQDIQSAETRLEQELGYSLKYLAYPFGEYNQTLAKSLTEHGYVAFGQHSGAVAPHSDFGALPRYPAAGIYANLSSLKVKLNTLAMPVLYAPLNPELSYANRQPQWTTKIDTTDINPKQLQCYFKGEPIALRWETADVFSLKADKPLNPGRARFNCTAPNRQDPSRYYWYSQAFFVPTAEGKWLD